MSTLTSDFHPPAREEVNVCCWARPGSRKLKQPHPHPLSSSAWFLSPCWLQKWSMLSTFRSLSSSSSVSLNTLPQ